MLLSAASSCRFCARQLLLLLLEQLVLLLELRIEPLALGDVLVGDDAAAVGHAAGATR